MVGSCCIVMSFGEMEKYLLFFFEFLLDWFSFYYICIDIYVKLDKVVDLVSIIVCLVCQVCVEEGL